jgi:hypothetical protein
VFPSRLLLLSYPESAIGCVLMISIVIVHGLSREDTV